MEWYWFILTGTILFLFFVVYRIGFVRGYKTGARRVLFEWKQTLEEEDQDGDIL